ncbi:hypothetical protein HDU76_003758, partial [Blyttiomyces sp. JEL0837]
MFGKCKLEDVNVTKAARLQPQGRYEPMLCWSGFYCPDTKTIITCPPGYFCPTGATAPKPCRPLSSCPAGSIVERHYGLIIYIAIIDLILIAFLFHRRATELRKAGLPLIIMIPNSILQLFVVKVRPQKPIRKTFLQTSLKWFNSNTTLRSATMAEGDNDVPRLSESTQINIDREIVENFGNGTRVSKVSQHLPRLSRTRLSLYLTGGSVGDEKTPYKKSMSTSSGIFDTDANGSDSDGVYGTREGSLDDERFDILSITSHISPVVEFFKSGFRGKENLRMNLEFKELKLSLGGGRTILEGVSGEIKAGRMTAIIGPSGAGKTTFMNVLMGKISRTGGEILVNGAPAELHRFRKLIGYVPQEDIMLRELTVREVLTYSARIRLPNLWSAREIRDYVDALLKVLNLEHVADMVIGDDFNRGISGGQRKRVNIGMELAAAPLAVFLDEPTSGLDSTSALKVTSILRSIARVGLTIVAVIHQPRIEIFSKFDDVLMIAPGGRTAYFGPINLAKTYFESLGFVFHPHLNPADVLMDILSGRGPRINNNGTTSSSSIPQSTLQSQSQSQSQSHSHAPTTTEELVTYWSTHGINRLNALDRKLAQNSVGTTTDGLDPKAVHAMTEISRYRGATFIAQIWYAHSRSLNQQLRLSGALWTELFVGSLAGLVIGVSGNTQEIYHGMLNSPYRDLSTAPNEWFLGLYGTLIGVAIAVSSAPAGVKIFGEEKLVFWRESASGHNTLAYFLGKNISSLYRVALSSGHFTAIYIFFSKPSFSYEVQYLLIFLNFFCIYGVSAVISMIVRRENASLLAVIISMFMAIFNGFAPTLADAR